MSIRKLASSTVTNTTGLGTRVVGATPTTPWVRNKSWSSFTAPTSSEERFIGLHAVWPESNFLALSAAGNYTVDWGDGLVENFSSGVTAQHEYDFADVDLANTNAPVTLQGGADTVTRGSHGYSNGDIVRLYNIVTTTGISANNPYYVISVTTSTFQLSLTLGGAAIDLVNDGSATLLPYKQAIVQVYPQAGQSLTSLNLHQRNSSVAVSYVSGFLDIALSGAYLTDLRIGVATPGQTTAVINFRMLEQVNIVRTDCKQLSYLFSSCGALQSVIDLGTSTASAGSVAVTFTDSTDTVNATAHGFRNGDAVIFSAITTTTGISTYVKYYIIGATANTFQVASTYGGTARVLTNDGSGVAVIGTDMSNLFQSCISLRSATLFNTAAVTDMTSMLNGCASLQSVPVFNTAAVTNMQTMFSGCTSLKVAPLFNTAAVTNMVSMFQNCTNLQSVSLFNTSLVTNMQSIFNGCASLQSLPLFNTAAVTNMASMFQNCTSLQSVPFLNTSAVTTMQTMFSGCASLQSVPTLNTAAVTNMLSLFSGCATLQSVPLLNTSAVTDMTNMFQNCASLRSVPQFNTAAVTNMLSMFQNCTNLITVPLFNTAAVTSMGSMFNGCTSLQSIPLLNTSAVTNMGSMFASCTSLQSVPLLSTGAVSSFSSMFALCPSLQSVPAFVTSGPTSNAGYTFMFGCPNLSRIQASGFKFTFSVANCKLSATALNEIYTNLPTVTSQTISVTGNYGTATDNPAIATAKGWTVTG